MSTILDVLQIQKEMKAIFEADAPLKAAGAIVEIEPYTVNLNTCAIAILRKSVRFGTITVNRMQRATVMLNVVCSTISYDSIFNENSDLDSLVEKVVRVIKDNLTWNGTVKTSQLTSIDYLSNTVDEAFLSFAELTIEMTIDYT